MNTSVSAFQRLFTHDVRRCEESERRLRYLEEQVKKTRGLQAIPSAPAETLDTLEPKLESIESELRDLNGKWEQLLLQKNRQKEHCEILTQPVSFFCGEEGGDAVLQAEEGLRRAGGLRYLTGVLAGERAALFERLVYRATRGNMFMRTAPAKELFEDPASGEQVEKVVFVVFFSAQRAHDKIRKLCESMQASLYPYNLDNPSEVLETTLKVQDELRDLETTLRGTEDVRRDILTKVKQNLPHWKKTVFVEKSVYNVLNLLSFKGQTVVAECWSPKSDLGKVQTALSEAERSSGAQAQSIMEQVSTTETPPTHFKTNKFTSTHQGIVNSYGIARYKEINPACFSVVTFPFLFGVMYGDIGHGLMITILSLIFIIKEKQMSRTELNEIVALVFGGRYILVMMGLFAVYMGFLYNDFFAMMIAPWGQPFWIFPENPADCDPGSTVWSAANASVSRGCKALGGHTLSFGVDVAWCETENKLEFYNGLKMKMAIILGVGQMSWGLFLSFLNHRYFKDHKHIYFGFIPECIFLGCTFGYMSLMMVIKWSINWPERMANNLSPPSLLETMTNFFLAPGSVKENSYLYVSAGFQNGFQTFLLLMAFLAIPVMLFPIPILEYLHNKASAYGELEEHHPVADPEAPADSEHEPFDMSEVVIKQVIHTIEFVLGCVSNTASYLRLWALSLAHAQLSEVFWNFAWMKPLTLDNSGVLVFCGYAVWMSVTLGVLCIMESLSAFLHALRLHWVEFQNKFYYGDGVAFVPFDLSEGSYTSE
eukprot:NODE_278_length_2537_cov_28.874196_g256_i0.p1 GENE.NODE_278_length_2537_cov_28.874196_g256_i0~~NODE_278_length_2537_cov_28.874196_g256_i0.p1  ORF type:complete len:828 (+),score=150.79 NODE_278_length_2537_cov_28.874196_g256_i0:186-2486(+)